MAYLTNRSREIRENRGEKIRGKKPSENSAKIYKFVDGVNHLYEKLSGSYRSKEFSEFLTTTLASMGTSGVDDLLNQLKLARANLDQLESLAQVQRANNYSKLCVTAKR